MTFSIPVSLLQAGNLCWRSSIDLPNKLSRFVFLRVQVEAVTIEIINFDDLTESRLRWITSHFKFWILCKRQSVVSWSYCVWKWEFHGDCEERGVECWLGESVLATERLWQSDSLTRPPPPHTPALITGEHRPVLLYCSIAVHHRYEVRHQDHSFLPS